MVKIFDQAHRRPLDMRFLGFAVVTGAAIMLGACGGEKAATTDSAAAPAAEAAAAPAEAAPAAGAMAPITGTTHEIKMIGDGAGYRFEPAAVTIAAGDGVKFTLVSGGPHNVAFDGAAIPAAGKAALMANMPEQAGELSGKMMLNADESYTVSFAGVAAGDYPYFCTPHLAMNMKGVITVK
jgi:plastocyanin